MSSPAPDLPPLATAEQYGQLVGDPPAGQDIGELLAAASAMVRDDCGWHIAPSIRDTVILDGSGSRDLLLPTLHLTHVESIIERLGHGGSIAGDATPLLEWSDAGLLRKYGRWTDRLRGVTVVFDHGYPKPSAGLVALVCTVAARASVAPKGVVRAQVGPVSETYSQVGFNVAGGTALLDHEREYLAQFRIPPRP